MADIRENVKNAWMKGMELIGNTASTIANNTKFKVDEMNLVNRRREILNNFGAQAYALWQKGVSFPNELEDQLKELKLLDEQLSDLRAERVSGIETSARMENASASVQEPADEAEDAPLEEPVPQDETNSGFDFTAVEKPAEPEIPKIEIETPEPAEKKDNEPLSDVISDLFGNAPSVDEMAGKVNQALDSLGDNLKKFAKEVDQGLSDLSDKIRGSGDNEDE